MLPKAKRLSRIDFSKRPLGSRSFVYGSVKALPGEARVGVVVSKKVSPKAVTRNALRRKFYAILRAALLKGHIRRSLIVYPNKSALDASFAELKTELEKALTR